MSRNILELKSIKIAPEKVQTLAAAKRLAKLKDFDLKEEFFEPVYHPADLVKDIAYYVEGETYNANVRVADIKGTLHRSYYGNHRVCQAKFLGLETVPCEVTEFVPVKNPYNVMPESVWASTSSCLKLAL